MSDVTAEITEMRFTLGDDVVYLRRTQMGDGTTTYDVWSLVDIEGVEPAATFTDDQFEDAKAAAVRLLAAKSEAKSLRDQADTLERDAVAAIAEAAKPVQPLPVPPEPAPEVTP